VIRFIAKTAVAAAAAGIMAAGMAAPAIAAPAVEGAYENHPSGGVDLGSSLCLGGLSIDLGLISDLGDIIDPELNVAADLDSGCDSQAQVLIDIEP
jgi:hypothetical protein